MKTRFFAVAAIAVMLLGIGIFAEPDSKSNAKGLQSSRLIGLLPASDAVAVFDSKRFLNDALPKVLSSNQPMMAQIMRKLSEMEQRTGIDLRKFEQVAVGVRIKQIADKKYGFEPVAIASGDVNAGALIAVAKIAAGGGYREEKIGAKTVYVFAAKDILKNAPVKPTNSKIGKIVDHAANALMKEVAVTALDGNTLAMGSLPRLREAVEGKSRVGSDITGLLSANGTSVMTFSAKSPGGLSRFLPIENDELGKNIDSIEYFAGSMDVAASGASVQMLARTKQPEQATGLKDTLEGLQMLGKAVLGNSKRADQQVYGRMVRNLKVGIRGSDLTLDLAVPQSDIDILISEIK